MWDNGPFWFGVVIGFITYRTLRHKSSSGISDIAAVIAAVGGAAVLKLFPVGTNPFDRYAFGLTVGLFVYLLISVVIASVVTGATGSTSKGGAAANEFLGD